VSASVAPLPERPRSRGRFGGIVRSVVVALSPQNPSPVIKQSATAFAFAAGLYLVVNVPGFGVTDWSAVWAATALMVLAVGFAVVFTTVHQKTHMVLIVPVLSLFAIGIMQAGVGALFTTLTILPILWIAAEEGRRWVFFTVVAATASLSLEVFWQGEAVVTVHDAARIVFTPLVFGLAAIVINEISRQSRRRVRANRDLMQQREAMLEDAVGYMRQLRENEGRMRAADQLTRSVLNSVTVQAVIGTNLTGLIDVWNPGAQSLLGLEPTEVQSRRHIFDFHVADELENRARELNYPAGATVLNPGFSALVEKARLGGAEEHEWTWVRADGSTLPVSVAVTPRVDQEGATIGYIFVGTDITVRKEVTSCRTNLLGWCPTSCAHR
jgi:PAS domain-containing protein